MKILHKIEINELERQQVFELWNNEYPEKLTYNSLLEFDNYLKNLSNLKHYLLLSDENLIIGWALTFERESQKWFAIIVSEKFKGKGLGKKMLDKLKDSENILNGWVIDHNNDKKKDGQTYISPLKFYEKCGFQIQTESRLELDIISAVKIKWTKNKAKH